MTVQELDSIFEKKTFEVTQTEKITDEAHNSQKITSDPTDSNNAAVVFKESNSSLHNSAKDETDKTHVDCRCFI